jgi:hypothetical protein
MVDEYILDQFEDYNYGNGLAICESLTKDSDLYTLNYDNEGNKMKIG